jgi:hypothetical protein
LSRLSKAGPNIERHRRGRWPDKLLEIVKGINTRPKTLNIITDFAKTSANQFFPTHENYSSPFRERDSNLVLV